MKNKLDCLPVPLVRLSNHTEQDASEYACARNDNLRIWRFSKMLTLRPGSTLNATTVNAKVFL